MTAWGRNHIIDKKSFQGSTRYIFSNVKVQHYDKLIVTIFEYVPLFLHEILGLLRKVLDMNTSSLFQDFSLSKNCNFSVYFQKSLKQRYMSEHYSQKPAFNKLLTHSTGLPYKGQFHSYFPSPPSFAPTSLLIQFSLQISV